MATLFLDRAQLELRTDGSALAVYENGRRCSTVPLNLLDRVVIQGRQTRLESGVLLKLAEAGAATVFLSARGSRQVALVLGPRHNDAAVRIAQTMRLGDADHCTGWSRGLVAAKLRRQHALLEQCEQRRPDARKALFAARETLDGIWAKVPDAPSVESLRGMEGAAARAYFAGLGAVFPPSVGFNGRNRRPPRDPVNACLSLGYTLMHFDAVRAAHAAGLDPLIGFYHRPSFGRESLASDLIEPIRPLVDAWVWNCFGPRRSGMTTSAARTGRACSARPDADISSAIGSRSRADTAAGCGCIVVSSPGTCVARGPVGWNPARKTCRSIPDAAQGKHGVSQHLPLGRATGGGAVASLLAPQCSRQLADLLRHRGPKARRCGCTGSSSALRSRCSARCSFSRAAGLTWRGDCRTSLP
jgi:CRISP-associated protein Cas1